MATTVVRAFSARLRRSSNQSGKYEPDRSFFDRHVEGADAGGGITLHEVLGGAKSRCRYPLRELVRSSERCP